MHGIFVNNLVKRYGNLLAVNGITFSIKPGDVVGLIGPNGAGKSTTMKSIVGLVVPDSGSILVDGFDVLHEPSKRRIIGFAPELPFMPKGYRVCEFLEELARLEGVSGSAARTVVREVLELFGLEDLCNRRIAGLSKGQKKRLTLAQAMLTEKKYLVLDEPFTGLDPDWVYKVKRLVLDAARRDVGVLVSSHLLRDLQDLVNYVVVINKGRVVFEGSIESATKMAETRLVVRLPKASDVNVLEQELVREIKARIIHRDRFQLVVLIQDDVLEEAIRIASRYKPLSIEYHRVTLDDLYEELVKQEKR